MTYSEGIPMFRAHPIEILWFIISLSALALTTHGLYLAVGDRAVSESAHERSQWVRTEQIVEMSRMNLWAECFRFVIANVLTGASAFSLFSLPADTNDFMFFPQTVVNVITGSLIGVTLSTWSALNLIARRDVEIANAKKSGAGSIS